MNSDQARLLLETECHFYRLQVSEDEFKRLLDLAGASHIKPCDLSDTELRALNKRLRFRLRNPVQR